MAFHQVLERNKEKEVLKSESLHNLQINKSKLLTLVVTQSVSYLPCSAVPRKSRLSQQRVRSNPSLYIKKNK